MQPEENGLKRLMKRQIKTKGNGEWEVVKKRKKKEIIVWWGEKNSERQKRGR